MEFKRTFTVLIKDEYDNCWGHGLFDKLEDAQSLAEALESNEDMLTGAVSLCVGPEGLVIGKQHTVIVTQITSLNR